MSGTAPLTIDLALPWFITRRDLACGPQNADAFFAHATSGAVALCRTCPASDDCRDWAVATRQDFGTWGGTSPGERRRLRKERAAA